MRKFHGIWLMVVLFAMFAVEGFAISVQSLTIAEQAHLGATHRVKITTADLTETTTNTAQTLGATFLVGAKQGVSVVAMQLPTVFDSISTNYTTSTLLTVGDGTDPDLFLTSTELNEDGTEVFLKFGRGSWLTATTATALNSVTASSGNFTTNFTLQTLVITNIAGATTQTVTVVTNVVNLASTAVSAISTSGTAFVTSQAQTDGRKLYTAADYVDFVFTPNAQESLSQLTSGEVWIYIKLEDANNLNP